MAGTDESRPAGAARQNDDETLAELLEAAKRDVAPTHGLDERHAYRLVGGSISELHADAKLMARELGVADPTERQRDEGGRYASGDMNVEDQSGGGQMSEHAGWHRSPRDRRRPRPCREKKFSGWCHRPQVRITFVILPLPLRHERKEV